MTNRGNKRKAHPAAPASPNSSTADSTLIDNTATVPAADGQPRFGQPVIDHADPTHFRITHGSDTAAYKILDAEGRAHELQPMAFPPARGGAEPRLTLAQILGSAGPAMEERIKGFGQIVFHSVGDTGNTRGPDPQNQVADKMEFDFADEHPENLPRFYFHLGDVIYSFGEAEYYYDQFYEPYRNYPAPILALAGNHDGMVAPNTEGRTLDAFLKNFCDETFRISPDAGGLDRTTMIQPGVYYTFEAPFVRIIALYTNTLEDPGVISSQGGTFKDVSDVQLAFLEAALKRVQAENYTGALIIAHHHPSYTAGGRHGWSETVRQEIDKICAATTVWPHAVLSAHAHNYQRFTRIRAGKSIPYIIAGNGGHGVSRLAKKNEPAIRAPSVIDTSEGEQVTLENYDDQDFGYLRIVANAKQLRIEYHPASDGGSAKTPDDSLTVDLATRQLVHFNVPDQGPGPTAPPPASDPGPPPAAPAKPHSPRRRKHA